MKILKEENNMYEQNLNIGIAESLKERKKIISFLGVKQSGTSFIINNIARIMARRGIDVAMLDMTLEKASYYIYTQNNDEIKAKVKNCFKKITEEEARGIEIEKNLTIYTDLPKEKEYSINVENILANLLKKHQIILIDTDFSTKPEYFLYSQQVYLVQTMDCLTIQPLTEFLSKLKSLNAIDNDKIRIVLNKYIKLPGLTINQLIGGLAFYNEPSMTYMQQIFSKDGVKYTTISYSQQAYENYLQDVSECKITIENNSEKLKKELEELADDIISD